MEQFLEKIPILNETNPFIFLKMFVNVMLTSIIFVISRYDTEIGALLS